MVRGLQHIRESLASRRPLRERYRQTSRLRKGLGQEVDLRYRHIKGRSSGYVLNRTIVIIANRYLSFMKDVTKMLLFC